ncbi:MAG: DUF1700 domain-containing protein [Clostridia bacterium]|nr:DUF1700 domain-containing protein [Clostridia bacterium]
MNKNEFISIMESKLIRLPKSDRDDILSDYEAHFAVELEKGLSEEEVSAQLGDPQELAATYLENLPENAKGAPYIAPEEPVDEQTQPEQAVPEQIESDQAQPDHAQPADASDEAQYDKIAGVNDEPAAPAKRNVTSIVFFFIVCTLITYPGLYIYTGALCGSCFGGIGLIIAMVGCCIGGAFVIPSSVAAGIGLIFLGIALGALGGLFLIAFNALIRLIPKIVKAMIAWGKSAFTGGNQ